MLPASYFTKSAYSLTSQIQIQLNLSSYKLAQDYGAPLWEDFSITIVNIFLSVFPETINHAPEISVDSNLIKNGDTRYMRSGQSIQFRCKGKTGGTIKWYKLRTILQRAVSIPIPKSMTYKQGQETLVLKIDQVILANAGVYSCRQSYEGKIYSSKVMLNVSAPGMYKIF